MKLKQFLEGYPSVLFSSEHDQIFITLRLMLYGMCSARMAKLLNHAARFLDKTECYLEIGTFTGFSLLAASYESGNPFFGIDNFSENFGVVGKVSDVLKNNLSRYPGHHTIIDGDFRNVGLKDVLEGMKIGVFLVDGKHTYEDVMESMEWAKPHLGDDAVIFFDDINVPGVQKAVDEYKVNPEFQEVFCAKSFFDNGPDRGMSSDRYIHNGFSMMAFRRQNAN